jgi:hypothetical protein
LVKLLVERGLKIATCTLWAPACTIQLFEDTYRPAIKSKAIEHFSLFTLTDEAEQADNCGNIYHKSLLYLVSNALEKRPRIPIFRSAGEPLLGMEKFVKGLDGLFKSPGVEWIRAPNDAPIGSPLASRARNHSSFDDDEATLKATLARILGLTDASALRVSIRRSAASQFDKRRDLQSRQTM